MSHSVGRRNNKSEMWNNEKLPGLSNKNLNHSLKSSNPTKKSTNQQIKHFRMTRTCLRSSFMMISGQWALRNKTSWSLFKFSQAAAHVTRRRSRVTRRSKNKIKAAQLTPRKVIVVMHLQVHTQERIPLPNRMIFWKNSKRPLTQPLIFWKLYCKFLMTIWLHICEEVWWPDSMKCMHFQR